MKDTLERSIIMVVKHGGQWAVEHEGRYFGHDVDKDVARAAAHRHAREMQDKGRPCQVRISGEGGYFSSAVPGRA
jgi:hypothetical protein